MKETKPKRQKHTNKKKGISLIVLVITIIVMIILAAAVILSLSSNGIIDRANEAVTKTDLKQVQTLASTIWSEAYLENKSNNQVDIEEYVREKLEESKINIDEYAIDVTNKGVKVESKAELLEKWKENITYITNDGVPIPKGFVASPYEGENTKAGGLVIYEINIEDTSNDIATKDGSHQVSLESRNQYVWVPVDKETFETTFIRRDFTTTATTNTSVVNEEGKYYDLGTPDKYWEVDPTTDETKDTNKKFIEISATPPSTTIKEVQEMYASVKEYGGFYIARYEAGLGADLTVPNVQRKELGTAANLPTGHDNVHFKMGQIPYTYIPWTWNYSMKEESNGAVSVSRSLYPNDSSNTTGVISTLTYGVQWDTAVQWFKTNGKYSDENTVVASVTNSIAYGNYEDHQITKDKLNPNAKYAIYNTTNYTLGDYNNVTYIDGESQVEKDDKTAWALSTGALKDAKVNNIYDIAGNMYELTMEGDSSGFRVRRGGCFSGSSSPVSNRGSSAPFSAGYYISFRPSLYIK